jgi:hypothetical protein
MTLCIAAACQHKEKSAFVLCSDTRSLSSSRDWGLSISSENADKARYFEHAKRFAALIAGHPTAGDEFLTMCAPAIKQFSERPDDPDDLDIHLNELFEGIRVAARTRIKQIQDHHIATNSPFKGYEDFLARGKASLPETQYRELWHDIGHLTLNAEVIIGGIHSGEPVLVKVDNKGNPHWEDQYSIVGTGTAEALAFLAQNEYDETEISLEDCLLRMVEALDFAATANNTVGHMTRFEVHIEDEPEEFDITDKFFETLKSKIRLSIVVPMGSHVDFLEKPNVVKPLEVERSGEDASLTSPEL